MSNSPNPTPDNLIFPRTNRVNKNDCKNNKAEKH